MQEGSLITNYYSSQIKELDIIIGFFQKNESKNNTEPFFTLTASGTLQKLAANNQFHLDYINNSTVKEFVLDSLRFLIQDKEKTELKLELLKTLERLLQLEINLETISCRTASVPSQYQQFFRALVPEFEKMLRNDPDLFSSSSIKLNLFVRIISYLFICLPYEYDWARQIVAISNSIQNDLMKASPRLVLHMTLNFFSESTSNDLASADYAFRFEQVDDAYIFAIDLFATQLPHIDDIDYEQAIFRMLIDRTDHLNQYLFKIINNKSSLDFDQITPKWLGLLERSHTRLRSVISLNIDRLSDKIFSRFIKMHATFCKLILVSERVALLIDELVYKTGNWFYEEFLKIFSIARIFTDPELFLQNMSKVMVMLFVFSVGCASRSLMPGDKPSGFEQMRHFWEPTKMFTMISIEEWDPILFKICSLFCQKILRNERFVFVYEIAKIVLTSLERKLASKHYTCLSDLLSQEFLDFHVDLILVYHYYFFVNQQQTVEDFTVLLALNSLRSIDNKAFQKSKKNLSNMTSVAKQHLKERKGLS